METNEQTNAHDDSEATEELDSLSATRQQIRQLISDYFAL